MAVSTIGVEIGYKAGVETDTITSYTGFTAIPDIKSHGSLVSSGSNSADATIFSDTDTTSSVALLGEGVQSIDFTANLTDAFITAWNDNMIGTAMGNNSGVWIGINNPKLSKATVFYARPVEITGYGEESANSLAEITVSAGVIGKPKLVDNTPLETTTSTTPVG